MTPHDVVETPTLSLFDPDAEVTGPPAIGEGRTHTSVPAADETALPPAASAERIAHNLTVIRLLGDLRERRVPPTDSEREALTRWAGWGAVPELFDETVTRYAAQRGDLIALLGPDGFSAARRSTINAHYTHPLIADAMWRLAERLSFPGVRVLEPGCGPGVFLARAPEWVNVTGVEVDPTTARIAETLHPRATICTASFADVRGLADGTFDLVIGNVPFGDVVLYDPTHNKGEHSIHNHFLVKSLALLTTGGLLIALTSRFTLDSQSDSARTEMHQMADLLAAVRLPAGAHRRVAGTDALTDVVVLRRRNGAPQASAAWVTSAPVEIEGEQVLLNRYFAEHPDHLAGTLAVENGPYARELTVKGDTSAESISEAILRVGENLAPAACSSRPSVAGGEPATVNEPTPADLGEHWDGHILVTSRGGFAEVSDGTTEPLSVPKNAKSEMRLLLRLRDHAGALLAEEAADSTDPARPEQMRAELRGNYQRYLRTYGPINRYKTHATGRVDRETGEPVVRRTYPRAVRLLMGDPLGALVLSLEHFDDDTQIATEADLLRRRVLHSRQTVTEAATPDDALAVCYDRLGRVDLELTARLLGVEPARARAALGDLVYEDPDSHALMPAAEYLSGNVRVKLDRAREAAVSDPSFETNVEALAAVLPVPLGADEVAAKLGAVWISDTVHQQFLRELLEDNSILVQYGGGNVWAVRGSCVGTLAESEWGTRRMPAPEIAAILLEQKPVVVRDRIPDTERYIVNADETTAAQEKATAMQERFAEWCWEDPERASDLLREYNTRFNSLVLRDYTALGDALTLPGLADTFDPHGHQRAAVARIICEPSVGLFHSVGAGKTAEMVIGSHELRRLGIIDKPAVVVPNHMLGQFAREWLQLYPMAKILAAGTDDLTKDNRRRFVARAAANSWDAIIMTRSAFERLGVSLEVESAYLARELTEIRDALDQQRARGAHLTIKRLEKKVMRAEMRMEKRLDGEVDSGVTFEQTGVDYLFVDEAHGYKNLATISNIQGAGIIGSKRAEDLYMKVEHLRAIGNDRIATFATATPIANSITEAHVMCRYLRPDLLEDAGIKHFDAWAATFGEIVTQMEMAVTGGGNYRLKTRFARFQNVPEMLRILHLLADVKTAEDLKLPTPPLKPRSDGQLLPETVVIPTPPEVADYLQQLAHRAEKVKNKHVTPEQDNMLKISTDGRKAALDMRLVADGKPISGRCKLEVVADNVARIHHLTRNIAYRVPRTDVRHPTLGSLQIVFCDLSTPHPTRWNAYHELRRLLIDRGLSGDDVRFAHEAKNDTEKARLFEACRSGQAAVLIGSTEKMGVGTNIQARAIAMHHVDCPWRPADIEQREGRILRQGNQHSAGVRIYRYVVEGSFDAYSWQTVERKARFIGQIMRGRFDIREIEEIADNALSFAEVKALAAGDPLILDQATLSAEVTRLQRLQRAYHNNQAALKRTVDNHTHWVGVLDREIAALEDAIARQVDTHGDKFAITIAGTVHTNRANAGIALVHLLDGMDEEKRPIGDLGGLPISGRVRYSLADEMREAQLGFDGLPANLSHATLPEAHKDPLKLIRQLESRANSLDTLRAKTIANRASTDAESERARSAIGVPFKYADELAVASEKLDAVNAELAAKAMAQEQQPAPVDVPDDHSTDAVAAPVGAAASDDIPI